MDIDAIPSIIRDVNAMHRLFIEEASEIEFPVAECMRFHNEFLPLHENGMSITAFMANRPFPDLLFHRRRFYDEENFGKSQGAMSIFVSFYSAATSLAHC